MASTGPLGPNHRVFNDQERAVLEEFRDKYMEALSPDARKDLAVDSIFPNIFNYWKGLGMVFTLAQEEAKKAVCRDFSTK